MRRAFYCWVGFICVSAGCGQASIAAPPPQASKEDAGGSSAEAKSKSYTPRPGVDPVATSLRGAPIPTFAVRSVGFSPDGKLLAVGDGEGMLRLWDLATKQPKLTIKAHTDWVFDVDFDRSGKFLATAGGDNFIKIWDVSTGKEVHQLKGHLDDVHGAAFSPDGKSIVSGSDDTTVMLWDVDSGTSKTLGRHEKQVTSVAFLPDGTMAATASRDGTVRLWKVPSGEAAGELRGHKADVLSIAVSADGKRIATASYDKGVRVWNVATRSEERALSPSDDWAFSVAISPDGKRLATGAGDHTVRIATLADGKYQQAVHCTSDIADVAFSPDGKLLAVGLGEGFVQMFAVEEHELKHAYDLKPERKIAKPEKAAAAIIAPQTYVDLHLAMRNPAERKAWSTAVASLFDVGDEFSLKLLKELDSKSLTVAQQELVRRTSTAVEKRLAKGDRTLAVAEIVPRLERASLCDLNCLALESSLVPWTLSSIRPHVERPDVRAELERIRSEYVPSTSTDTAYSSMKERVRSYAGRLLKPDEKSKPKP